MAPPGNPNGSEKWIWPDLMTATMTKVNDVSSDVSFDGVSAAALKVGLEAFALLSNRPDLFDAFAAELGL